MNYTNEQLAALADKGAEAASAHLKATGKKVYWNITLDEHDAYCVSAFKDDAPARIAFARAVLDGAAEMRPKAEAFEDWLPTLNETLDLKTRDLMWAAWLAALRHYEAELADLHNWKAQMLAVEAEWDEQALAKKLGVPLGQSCRKGITEGVERLLKENEELKAQRSPWTPCAEPPAEEWIPLGPEDVSGNDIFRAVERNERAIWFKPVGVMSDGICLANLQLLPWQLLLTDYERSRDDGQTWQPCKKPCTPTPQPV